MTKQALRKTVALWRKRLGLSHWKITVKSKPNLVTEDGTELFGYVQWETEYRIATIAIKDGMKDDVTESTIIHELLHVLLEGHNGMPGVKDYDGCYEFGLNILSQELQRGSIAGRK